MIDVGLRIALVMTLLIGCHRVFGIDPIEQDASPPLPPETWLHIDAGATHSCGIRRDHTLHCWGRNDLGQLGIGTASERTVPTQVGSDTDWEQVVANQATTCAIKLDHSLWCWGWNHVGQVGDGSTMNRDVPVRVPGAWSAVAVGRSHTCAIDEGGALACWGEGGNGERGVTPPSGVTFATSPVPVGDGGTWRALAAGEKSTCGIRTDDTLWCWGSDDHGRLGLGGIGPQFAPARVGDATWKAVALEHQSVCGIQSDGGMYCWGANDVGQLASGTMDARMVPTRIAEDPGAWSAVAAGTRHACGVLATGELSCWGSNHRGQLAHDLTRPLRLTATPVEEVGVRPWSALGLGEGHTCAIDAEGSLWCVGYKALGVLGIGEGSQPTPRVLGGTWARPSLGEDATCAVADGTGELACWGFNGSGLLGDGTNLDRQIPPPPGTGTSWVSFDMGDHVCAIAADNRRWCWGRNDLYQLGDGSTVWQNTPKQMGTSQWAKVSSARSHTCALNKVAPWLYCWGRNAELQAGVAGGANVMTPTPVGTEALTWKDIATGIDFSCGIKNDNKVYCWGHSARGQLGNAGAPISAVPTAIASQATFSRVVAGARHACALNGTTATCWGWNQFGQLGNGTVTDQPTPTVIPGAWSDLALGEEHTCGVRMDQTLWCWGRNHYGQSGATSFANVLDQTQVGTDADWVSVAAGPRHTCALKSDGRMACWGANLSGALGDGAAWTSTLVRVP